jgi:hypothetical protein
MWAYCCLLYKHFIDFALAAQNVAQPHISESYTPKAGIGFTLPHLLDVLLEIDRAK